MSTALGIIVKNDTGYWKGAINSRASHEGLTKDKVGGAKETGVWRPCAIGDTRVCAHEVILQCVDAPRFLNPSSGDGGSYALEEKDEGD